MSALAALCGGNDALACDRVAAVIDAEAIEVIKHTFAQFASNPTVCAAAMEALWALARHDGACV